MVSSEFPGEKYLLEELPDYDNERQMLVVKFVLTFLFWTIFVPLFLASEKHGTASDEGQFAKTSDETPTIASTTTTTKSSSTIRGKKTTTTTIIRVQQQRTKNKAVATKKQNRASKRNELKRGKGDNSHSTQQVSLSGSKSNSNVKVINGFTNLFCFVGCILHIFYVLLISSPDNYHTSRTVFETPLLTQDECDYLVEMAERVAGENYDMAQKFVRTGENSTDSSINRRMEGYLKEPFGWQKTRHKHHPTTDLNLVTDSFSDEDRAWIQQRLDARLAPTLERIFGVPQSAIRANDMFLVRYDGDRQASLSRHTDDGSITFQTLLSHGFEGGGTRYWNRVAPNDNSNTGSPFTYVLPKAGMMTTFPAMIEHEGVQTTKGRRYLLIGFLAVDKIDPWTHRSTGLTWFSSWGSLNWASVKFKEGMKAAWMETGFDGKPRDESQVLHTHQARQVFEFVYKLLVGICDAMFTHRFAVLVNETSAEDYLRDLDEAYTSKVQSSSPSQSSNHQQSSWFSGQQISVNIDGSFRRNWGTRQDADDKFERLTQSKDTRNWEG